MCQRLGGRVDNNDIIEQNAGADLTRRHFIQGAGAFAAFAGVLSIGSLEALAAPMAPKRGGTFRLGLVGGSNDILDAQYILAIADQARLVAGFEGLLNYDDKFAPTNKDSIAEEVTAKNASKYVVRLKDGVEFHNGKTVTAEDIIYSFQRASDPALPGTKSLRVFLNSNSFRKIDKRTVEFNLLTPNVDFRTGLCSYGLTVVPVGYTRGGTQIGTGPFKLKSFTPGRESVHTRFANYWDTGKPYFDEVRIISFADKTPLISALQAGQIDAAIDAPVALIPTLRANKKLKINETAVGGIRPIAMEIDTAPFNDVRVRQALKLLVDRKKLVKQVLSGHGTIANDDYSPLDMNYNANNFPQRVQDIPTALGLLKKAGYSKANPLSFDLPAPDDTDPLPSLVKAFAEQVNSASGGVVKVNPVVQDGGTFWNKTYMNAPIFTTYWNPKPYFAQVAGMIDTYPETHFPAAGSNFRDIYKQAVGTLNPTKRRALVAKLQKEEFEQGGYIIPFFTNTVDAYNKKLQGVVQRKASQNLDTYGRHFKNFWFA